MDKSWKPDTGGMACFRITDAQLASDCSVSEVDPPRQGENDTCPDMPKCAVLEQNCYVGPQPVDRNVYNWRD